MDATTPRAQDEGSRVLAARVAAVLQILIGLPSLSGPFLFTIAAQVAAAAIYLIFLRPDPLKLAQRIGRERDAAGLGMVDIPKSDPSGVRTGMIALALSHATMVSVMAMTPVHLVQNGELPMTPWGFRAMAGPFERLGGGAFSVLGIALAVVCAVDIVAGVWLWRLQRRGLRLGLVTALPQLALGLGFALPFQLASIPIRVVLGLAARRSLR